MTNDFLYNPFVDCRSSFIPDANRMLAADESTLWGALWRALKHLVLSK